jgi:hypothetical protein
MRIMHSRNVNDKVLLCIRCKKEKTSDSFYLVKDKKYRDSLCKQCRVADACKWAREHKERVARTSKKSHERRRFFSRCKDWIRRRNYKYQAIKHYGKNGNVECCWPDCGIQDLDVLTLDHINNDGGGSKRGQTNMGQHLYRKLARLNWPEGFQTLCANHQMKKEILRHRAAMDKRLEQDELKLDWESVERQKAPWIKENVKYGQTIPPQKDQKSNTDLTDEMVLQRRDEKIGNSSAPPISGIGQDHGAAETSRSKQIHSDSGVSGI